MESEAATEFDDRVLVVGFTAVVPHREDPLAGERGHRRADPPSGIGQMPGLCRLSNCEILCQNCHKNTRPHGRR